MNNIYSIPSVTIPRYNVLKRYIATPVTQRSKRSIALKLYVTVRSGDGHGKWSLTDGLL
jgi:hypothetical protein